MWTIINSIATSVGYFFTFIILIGVIWAISYWLYKIFKAFWIFIITHIHKIKRNRYTYRIEYKYLNYSCFMFDSIKDWFFVIRRKESCQKPEYLKSISLKENLPDKFGIDKDNYGYDICKYKTFKEAKEVLNDYLKTHEE